MKYKYILMAIAIIVPVSAFATSGSNSSGSDDRENNEVEIEAKIDTKVEGLSAKVDTSVKTTAVNTISTSTRDKGNSTSTNSRNKENKDEDEDNDENATTTDDNDDDNKGKSVSEEHRSAVATFVKSLLSVADRQGGIGAEVRIVAQSQNDSASTTIKAIEKVEERGSLRTFLFGSDYKNLGVIRSQIATIGKNIEKLKTLLEKTLGTTDKAEISAQIKVLEDQKTKLDAYVEANEDVFSLFGWFNRLFN